MNQRAILDNVVLLNVEQRVGQTGYPYSMLTIQVSQPGRQGATDVAQTEVMCGRQEILAALQPGGVYSMEFEARVGKPGQNGKRYLNMDLKGVRQTGGAQSQSFDQAPPQQNFNQAPQQQMQQQQAPMQQPMQQQAQAAPPQQGMTPPPAPNAYDDFDSDIPF